MCLQWVGFGAKVLLVSAGCSGSVQRDWSEFGVGVSVDGGTREVSDGRGSGVGGCAGGRVDKRKEESKTKERVVLQAKNERVG